MMSAAPHVLEVGGSPNGAGPLRRSGRPASAGTRLRPPLSVAAIALCGVICGADSRVEVAAFGAARRKWLATCLELPSGIPSHDTFGPVFAGPSPCRGRTL